MSNEEELLKLAVRKRISAVWTYFKKISKQRVQCKLCLHEQNYQGTTGNQIRHLKNKHNIDATVKGQIMTQIAEEPYDIPDDRQRELDFIRRNIKNSTVDSQEKEERQQRKSRTKVISYCEDTDIDPYGMDAATIFTDYIDANVAAKSIAEKSTPPSSQSSPNKRHGTITVEEERILAETEYFREKAAYYRMQKNLTALQAKKIKYELDQMV